MPPLSRILGSVVRGAIVDSVNQTKHEQEMMATLASQDASKSAKDDASVSNDEAADLVEEARASAHAEGQARVNSNQHNIVLLLAIAFFILVTMGPGPPGY